MAARPDYALTRISDGDGRRIEARRVDPSIYDLPPGPERKPVVVVPTVLGRPVALLMNLPQLAEDIPAGRPYAAVFARPWYGEAAIWRSATEDGFEFSTRWAGPARIGALAFDLYAGPPGRFDLGNEAWIDLPSAALASVTDQALFAGENALAVESATGLWEVLQFATAELMSPAAGGFAACCAGNSAPRTRSANPAPAGARVVMLDAAVGAALHRRGRYRPALELAHRPGARRRRRSDQPRRSPSHPTSPGFTYSTAMATADFGGPVTSLAVRVFQIGALGRGAPGEALITA